MACEVNQITQQALSLPANDRALLAERLLASLDEIDEPEAERRYGQDKASRIAARPADEAMRDARALPR